ncbi:Splicing factor 3A subunit 3 [Diplonema papillatum]|nr:Splicing factor 3A subunit 3 [Diplonema papillatum]WGM49955.1 SF3A3 [Diplonema papillatum]
MSVAATDMEVVRQLHEDIERHVEEVVTEVQYQPQGQLNKMHHEHFIRERMEDIRGRKRRLVDYYKSREGEDGQVKPEAPLPLSTVEQDFYQRIADTKEYYRKYPDLAVEKPKRLKPDPEQFKVHFSGEEGFGRYLDLHEVYAKFMALPFNFELSETRGKTSYEALAALKVRPIDYSMWIRRCTMFHNLPRNTKNQQYKEYLEAFLQYLISFYERTQPLSMDAAEILKEGEANFAERWASGSVLGWDDVKMVDEEKEKKKMTKAERRSVFQKSVARLEELVQRFYDMLAETVEDTLVMLERKETKSKEEIDAERERERTEAYRIYEERYLSDQKKKDDMPKALGNAKNLPLGFDGQPIPVWLYRLHGLNMKYSCEICRGYTYIGPKAFDKHFQEPRHTNGMRCLRIPNTRHFHHITGIQDAIGLWKKLKDDVSMRQWVADNEQEFEDAEGHVFNKKTRDDMRRQGLM